MPVAEKDFQNTNKSYVCEVLFCENCMWFHRFEDALGVCEEAYRPAYACSPVCDKFKPRHKKEGVRK